MKPKQANIDETKLLADLRKGEPRAVQEWFNHYHDRLLNSVLARVSNRNDAEEIVQETFLNCLKHLPLYRAEASIWTWMNSIARHEIADYYRKRYARKAIQTLPLHEWLLAKNIHDSHEISEQVVFVLNKMKKNTAIYCGTNTLRAKGCRHCRRERSDSQSHRVRSFRAREEFRVLWAAGTAVVVNL